MTFFWWWMLKLQGFKHPEWQQHVCCLLFFVLYFTFLLKGQVMFSFIYTIVHPGDVCCWGSKGAPGGEWHFKVSPAPDAPGGSQRRICECQGQKKLLKTQILTHLTTFNKHFIVVFSRSWMWRLVLNKVGRRRRRFCSSQGVQAGLNIRLIETFNEALLLYFISLLGFQVIHFNSCYRTSLNQPLTFFFIHLRTFSCHTGPVVCV